MRHIANATYMSLDGVVQHPELWTFDYRSDDAAQVSHDQLFAADALIMGRHTYDIFASHWPAATDPDGFADRMNTIPKYVLSRTLSEPSWTNTTVLAGDNVVDRIRALKQEPGQDILQYGYGPVTRLLIDHGLLDELHIWLHPLLVGNTDPGDHIGAVGAASRWQLDDLRRHDSGLVILSYRRPEAPTPTTGRSDDS
jgi:dihydrofolate reductase